MGSVVTIFVVASYIPVESCQRSAGDGNLVPAAVSQPVPVSLLLDYAVVAGTPRVVVRIHEGIFLSNLRRWKQEPEKESNDAHGFGIKVISQRFAAIRLTEGWALVTMIVNSGRMELSPGLQFLIRIQGAS